MSPPIVEVVKIADEATSNTPGIVWRDGDAQYFQ
jgi:hypothetical protein